MVKGLAFLSKKSWHTKNLSNQKRVWEEEQKQAVEAQQTKELAKQIQQEREQEELERITGKKSTMLDRGIDWMYHQGGGGKGGELAQQDAEKKAEEYLLGKEYVGGGTVQGDFDLEDPKQGIHQVLSATATITTTSTNAAPVASLHGVAPYDAKPGAVAHNNNNNYYNVATEAPSSLPLSVHDQNENFRLRNEDPMYMVSQQLQQREKKHQKTKELYERVMVGVDPRKSQKKRDDDDDEDDHSSSSCTSGRHYDRRTRAKKEKKKHQTKKKKKRKKSTDRKRHKDDNNSDSDDNDDDDDKKDYYRRSRRQHRQKRRSRSRSSDSSNGSSHSRDRRLAKRHKRRNDRCKYDDDYDDNSKRDHDYYNGQRYKSRSKEDYDGRKHHSSGDRQEDHHYHHYYQYRHGQSKTEKDDYKGDDRKKPYQDVPTNDDQPLNNQNRGYYGLQQAGGTDLVSKNDIIQNDDILYQRRDLGPDDNLLRQKRQERDQQRKQNVDMRHARRHTVTSEKQRQEALQEMQDNARKIEQQRVFRQSCHNREEEEEQDDKMVATGAGSSSNSNRGGNASFLKEIIQQTHGLAGKESLSERISQKRHTNQRLNDSFLT
jgi:hypothetical protein